MIHHEGASIRYKVMILEVADGQTGLSIAKKEYPDAIFLDLLMPGMSGFEVLVETKKNPELAKIPVIVVTAKSLDETERATLDSQARAVISKELLSVDLVIDTLKRVLNSVVAEKQARGV